MRTPTLALFAGLLLAAAAPAQQQDCSAPSAPIPCGQGMVVNSPAPPPLIVPTPARPPAAPAPVRAPKAARPPLPRHDLAAYIHEADYPAAALRDRESGTVRFTLDVGPDGRVTGCTVTRSSGNSWLDSSTCRILRSRARFTPAIDFNGNPTTGRIQQHFTWKLPPHKAR